jgi:hypothetical protein
VSGDPLKRPLADLKQDLDRARAEYARGLRRAIDGLASTEREIVHSAILMVSDAFDDLTREFERDVRRAFELFLVAICERGKAS